MLDSKVSLTITMPGRVMFSKQVCLENTKTTETKDEKGKKKIKVYRDPNYFECTTTELQSFDRKGRPIKGETRTEYIYTRKCIPAKRVLNISQQAYDYFISKDSWGEAGFEFRTRKIWEKKKPKERLYIHLARICDSLGGTSFQYKVNDDDDD